MLVVTVFGGAIAVILALFLYAVQKQIIVLDLQSAIGAMFIIGPVEEFGKLAGLLLTFHLQKRTQ
jgi:RsiW-degrading membrane proteinase PrsW (M82 family)